MGGWFTHCILLITRSLKQIFRCLESIKLECIRQTKYNSLSANSKYDHHDAKISLNLHASVSYLFGGNHHGGTEGQSTVVNVVRKGKRPENLAHTTTV